MDIKQAIEHAVAARAAGLKGIFPMAAQVLADENSRLQKALAEIEKTDAKAMYESCPDCDYAECSVTKRCKDAPNSPIGKLAVAALKTPNYK